MYCKRFLPCLQVGQTAEALNAARAEVAQAEKDAAAVKKRADDLTVAAGKKSAEADDYRDKWEKMKQQVSVAKSAEREHWERAKQVSRLCA
jgi:predicted  nucleic acid-binding Zn-ribbon protein